MRALISFIAATFLLSVNVAAAPGERKIDCKVGPEDEHARIAVHLIGGKVESFAYYSKWRPHTCSVDAERDDGKSNWRTTGTETIVDLYKGSIAITKKGDELLFKFNDVDRTHYCGMPGTLNGTMKVRYKPSTTCSTLNGLMERDPPSIEHEIETHAPNTIIPPK